MLLISVINDCRKEIGGNPHTEISPSWWLKILGKFNQINMLRIAEIHVPLNIGLY